MKIKGIVLSIIILMSISTSVSAKGWVIGGKFGKTVVIGVDRLINQGIDLSTVSDFTIDIVPAEGDHPGYLRVTASNWDTVAPQINISFSCTRTDSLPNFALYVRIAKLVGPGQNLKVTRDSNGVCTNISAW